VSAEHTPDRVALGAFLGAVVIGGSNFVAVRFSNRELDPLWGAGLRFGLAAAVFAVLVAVLRLPFPRRRVLGPAAVYGLLAFGGTYGCLYWALQDVPAGIGAVVMAVGPLLTLLLAVGHGLERLTVRALVGALVALGGTTLIFFQSGTDEYRWQSYALLIAAVLCASEAVIVSKRIGPQHPVVTNVVGMTAGSAALLLAAVLAGESFVLPAGGETQVALVYLVAATVGLFLLVLYVVQRWTASATAYVFVLMPIVALIVGALVAEEEITATTILGGAIVFAGVYLGALARSDRGSG